MEDEKQETIPDIIAEKRRRADEIERDVEAKMKSGEMVSDQFARELISDLRKEADRLEAAHKRIEVMHNREMEYYKQERNAAKLREVVEDLLYMAKRYVKKTPATETVIFDNETGRELKTINYHGTIRMAETAIAAPARNCDRFNSGDPRKDASDAWDAYEGWEDAYRGRGEVAPLNTIGWLFAKAEGGAK